MRTGTSVRTHAYTHTHTHTGTCTHKHSDCTKPNLHSLKQAANRDLDKDSNMEPKTWQVYSFGKRNVFRLHLSESREAFCQREWEGHSMLMDWRQKRHANQQWRVWCEESGGWEYQKSREYWRVCKVIDGHIAKTEQCSWYIYSRECLSCTEFFAGLGASGEIETEVWCSQFYIFLCTRQAAQFCMRQRLWTAEAGRPKRRELQ